MAASEVAQGLHTLPSVTDLELRFDVGQVVALRSVIRKLPLTIRRLTVENAQQQHRPHNINRLSTLRLHHHRHDPSPLVHTTVTLRGVLSLSNTAVVGRGPPRPTTPTPTPTTTTNSPAPLDHFVIVLGGAGSHPDEPILFRCDTGVAGGWLGWYEGGRECVCVSSPLAWVTVARHKPLPLPPPA